MLPVAWCCSRTARGNPRSLSSTKTRRGNSGVEVDERVPAFRNSGPWVHLDDAIEEGAREPDLISSTAARRALRRPARAALGGIAGKQLQLGGARDKSGEFDSEVLDGAGRRSLLQPGSQRCQDPRAIRRGVLENHSVIQEPPCRVPRRRGRLAPATRSGGGAAGLDPAADPARGPAAYDQPAARENRHRRRLVAGFAADDGIRGQPGRESPGVTALSANCEISGRLWKRCELTQRFQTQAPQAMIECLDPAKARRWAEWRETSIARYRELRLLHRFLPGSSDPGGKFSPRPARRRTVFRRLDGCR